MNIERKHETADTKESPPWDFTVGIDWARRINGIQDETTRELELGLLNDYYSDHLGHMVSVYAQEAYLTQIDGSISTNEEHIDGTAYTAHFDGFYDLIITGSDLMHRRVFAVLDCGYLTKKTPLGEVNASFKVLFDADDIQHIVSPLELNRKLLTEKTTDDEMLNSMLRRTITTSREHVAKLQDRQSSSTASPLILHSLQEEELATIQQVRSLVVGVTASKCIVQVPLCNAATESIIVNDYDFDGTYLGTVMFKPKNKKAFPHFAFEVYSAKITQEMKIKQADTSKPWIAYIPVSDKIDMHIEDEKV